MIHENSYRRKIHFRMSPNLKQDLPCYGLLEADENTWYQALGKYAEITDFDESLHWRNILGCSNNINILKFYLNWSLNNKMEFYKENRYAILSGLSESIMDNSEIGVNTILDFVVKRIVGLKKKCTIFYTFIVK